MILFLFLALLPLCVAFLLSVKSRNASLVDIFWAPSFLFLQLAGIGLWGVSPRAWALFFPLLLWSIRLTLYLAFRYKKRKRDWRYEALTKNWTEKNWPLSCFFKIYLPQAVCISIIGLPLLLGLKEPRELGLGTLLALLLALVALLLEGICDYQKDSFKKNSSKEAFLSTGFWKYSRHPNYVAEWLFWVALYFVSDTYRFSPFTLASPLLLYLLLRFVSGVPILEKRKESQPGYLAYREKTAIFLPLPFSWAKRSAESAKRRLKRGFESFFSR